MPPSNHDHRVANILVVRFSALGDVILTKPVLREFIEKYPGIKISLASQNFFRPIFEDLPGLSFIGVDLKNKHKGLKGLWKLSRELKPYNFNIIIDLHFVLRSVILAFFLNIPFKGVPVARIDKGRKQKRLLTRRYNKILIPLKHTVERYADVFTKAGFPLQVNKSINLKNRDKKTAKKVKIGIAPLSRHPLKEWPVKYMTDLANRIVGDFKCEIYMLGGAKEVKRLEEYAIPNAQIMAGKLDFAGEIQFIKTLDLIITMDSANMHLAGELGIPAISIWGPTHPYAGFSPVGNKTLIIQNSVLNCRPCSVFGSKPCYRKDHACMNELYVDTVYKEVKAFIFKLMDKTGR